MPDINWSALGLLVACALLAVLYGLAVSGHFPAHFRSATLQRGWGALLLWGTMAATVLAAGAAGLCAWDLPPWGFTASEPASCMKRVAFLRARPTVL